MAVYQEKNKSKWTKDGRKWYYRCYYSDIYGNRKQKISRMFLTKLEAQEEERKFLFKITDNSGSNSNVLFKDVYYEWLEFYKRQVKSTSYYSTKKRSDKHILSFFECFKLNSINTSVVLKWLEYLDKIDLNQEYQNIIIGNMQKILSYAVENYNFDVRVKNKLQKKKVELPARIIRDSEINYWTYEEFEKFINVVDNDYYLLIFKFLYYTGVRLGELIALTWNCIDFRKRTVKITKTFTNNVEQSDYAIISPKTKNSIREIELTDDLINMLRDHYFSEKEIYDFNEEMFVFGNVYHLCPTNFRRILNKYIDIAKVKKITPHGFRHSHASLLINLGCDFQDVAERLGDTIQVVESTYYHMYPNKKKNAVNLLNNIKN